VGGPGADPAAAPDAPGANACGGGADCEPQSTACTADRTEETGRAGGVRGETVGERGGRFLLRRPLELGQLQRVGGSQ
jgi:hypothetical protein